MVTLEDGPPWSASRGDLTPIPMCDMDPNNAVLRFYCYEKEKVEFSPDETTRIRHYVLTFWNSDQTIMLVEPREANSGLQQGLVFKRAKVPLRGGGPDDFVTAPRDLQRGGTVSIYGRELVLVDCDPFTEYFYSFMGWPMEPPQELMPQDTYMARRHASTITAGQSSFSNPYGDQDASLRQFMENDRKVLRFKAVWTDNREVWGPDSRIFSIYYFLADDSCAVNEELTHNDGREPYRVFLRRQRLPKAFTGPQCACTLEGADAKPTEETVTQTLYHRNSNPQQH